MRKQSFRIVAQRQSDGKTKLVLVGIAGRRPSVFTYTTGHFKYVISTMWLWAKNLQYVARQ